MEFTYFLAFNRFVSKLFYRIQTHLVVWHGISVTYL